MSRFDCHIIGGGLVGLCTALELHHRGLRVQVLEQGQVGRESSWAGGGILSPLEPWKSSPEFSALVSFAQEQYPELCMQLQQATGIDPEFRVSGLLVCGLANAEREQLFRWANQHRQPVRILQHHELDSLEPHIHPGIVDAFFLETVAQVRNPRLLHAMHRYLLKAGVEILEETGVTGFRTRKDTITTVQTDHGDEFPAENIVVASGAWSSRLVPDYPVKPIRGQMLGIQTPPGMLQRILVRDGFYLIPRIDGLILAGSSREDVGFHKDTTRTFREKILQFVESMLTGINRYPVRHHWSGLRPATPSGVPYICKHPRIANLYLNYGHYRNGILLAPAAAVLLADILQGRESFVDAGHFNLVSEAVVNA